MLDINQISTENFSVDLSKKIDVCEIIRKVVRLNKCYGMKRYVTIKLEIFGDIRPINLDAKRLKQVMMNLISNAIKYTKEKTEVKVVVQVVDDFLEISVIDAGYGMNEEQIKIAMKKYGRVANENHRGIDSVGLGLPITKVLVETQKGEMQISSIPNQGTCMKIKFSYSLN